MMTLDLFLGMRVFEPLIMKNLFWFKICKRKNIKKDYKKKFILNNIKSFMTERVEEKNFL